MTYLSGKAQKKRSYIRYALIASVFLLVVIFWPPIKKYSYTFLEPVIVRLGITKTSFTVFPEFFGTYVVSHKSLATKNRALEIEIERLENALADKDALLREHNLEDTLSITATTSLREPLVLYPIMQDVTRMYSTILLSKGFKDGVDVGDTVYVRGNQAACTVREVFNATALCVLFTASGMKIEGVTSSSSITLSLVGRGGHFMADVVRDTPVSVGEIVYMRSNPKVILGTVKEVSNNNQDTSWHIFVEGAYNPVTSSIFYVQQ